MEKINVNQLDHLRVSANVYLLLVEAKIVRNIYPSECETGLMVELAEFLSHFPKEFKFWRFCEFKELDKKAALEELSDCINFMNFIAGNYSYLNDKIDPENYIDINNATIHDIRKLILDSEYNLNARMSALIFLGFKFGFTWDEIYEATLNKIAIINERLNNETDEDTYGRK